MAGSGTPGNGDDWFADAAGRRTAVAGEDDWIAPGAEAPRRRQLERPRRQLSPRTAVVALAVLVLVVAGIAAAFIFTGSSNKATPPPTQPTTTHRVTTQQTTTVAHGSAAAAPTVTLKPGDKGPQVKRLQRFLRLFGYSTGKVDGDYGPATQAAVKRFQAASKLTADGVVGPATLKALKQALGQSR
jgi:hypothetical protein